MLLKKVYFSYFLNVCLCSLFSVVNCLFPCGELTARRVGDETSIHMAGKVRKDVLKISSELLFSNIFALFNGETTFLQRFSYCLSSEYSSLLFRPIGCKDDKFSSRYSDLLPSWRGADCNIAFLYLYRRLSLKPMRGNKRVMAS